VKRWFASLALAAGLAAVALTPAVAQRPRPAVLLVSLDGFGAEYLGRMPTPNLDRMAARGVRARWMHPSFPTLTFPNHYTIVTGLRPAHHGVVGNTMVDPATGGRFRIGDTLAVRDSRWWGGEPLWVTAEQQGLRAASFFWVGSEAEILGVRPTFWKPYDGRFPYRDRVDTVLTWLARTDSLRPSFVTLYFSAVDDAGHRFGPESPELRAAVQGVDSVMGYLLDGMRSRGLENTVNVIVVSDHGMAGTGPERRVFVDDYLDRNLLDVTSLGAFLSFDPRSGITADSIVRALSAAPHLRVYRREDTPERWRYRDHPRIAAVIGVAEEGWTVTSRASASLERENRPGGAHGFDSDAPSMRAIFLAAGPAFRRGQTVEPFDNVHVYELVCAVLGLRPAANDGSLAVVRGMLR
jgi:predicted AlkP superfamily pyrophosphatase or phosphodiesterase